MFDSNRTFGIEIELYMPFGFSIFDLAGALSEAGVPARAERYNHAVRRTWKVTTDASLGRGHGAEVVSPILRGQEGIDQIQRVAEVLLRVGCRVETQCGVHVHVGAADLSVAQLGRVAKNYIKFETFFDHIMPKSRRACNNRFVASNRNQFWGYDNTAVNRAFDAIDAANNRGDLICAVSRSRYTKLNFTSLETYGTIEFRQHSGTVEADKLTNWTLLCLNFVDRSCKSAPRKRVTEREISPAEELTRFFNMFDVLKPVQRFYRERMKHFARLDREAVRPVRRRRRVA